MVSIKVVYKETGKPAHGIRVGLSAGIDGVWHEYTNSDGEAHFGNASPGNTEIYINSQTYKEYVSGIKVIYI